MPLLDSLLGLLGTNRTRMQWKLRAWQRSWERRKASLANRTKALSYEHQTCPSCGHPASADEKVCTRCGDALGGRMAHRLRKAGALVWAPGVPVVATLLCASIAVMYVVMLVWAGQHGSPDIGLTAKPRALLRFGSLWSPAVDEGQWWRLSTSTFLHAGLLHLAFNAASLWSVAVYLEDTLGKAKTLALYLALGIVASLVSYGWHRLAYGGGNSVGASGAICGLIGVAIGFSLRRRNAARHLSSHYVGWAVWIGILGFSGWNIDNAGHLGGLIPGLLLGFVVRRRRDTSPRARWWWAAATIVAIAATVACFLIAGATPLPESMRWGEY
jgi:rhomboid protease GluP